MKELTIESKAKAYDEALGKAKKLYEKGTITESIGYIFPELEKSENERVRKALLNEFIHLQSKGYKFAGLEGEEIIAWLVKQGSVEEIVARCKKSWYNEGKIAGMAEGLSDDEKYQQGWHDALEKQNEQNPAWSEDDERIALGIEQLCNCASLLNILPVKINKVRQWLKSLKDRVQPQKQWKPSEEQMDALEHFVRSIGESGYASPYNANLKLVHSLLNDLKKLKEE